MTIDAPSSIAIWAKAPLFVGRQRDVLDTPVEKRHNNVTGGNRRPDIFADIFLDQRRGSRESTVAPS
ncbi:MAG: hypothetical protein R3A46_05385 [Thermomicrobiales bacterium]